MQPAPPTKSIRFAVLDTPLPSHSVIEANRSHFDSIAHRFDRVNPLRQRILDDIAEAVLEECDVFDEDEPRCVVMDYACGLMSQRLSPYCKELIGVDISPTMVDYFNTKVANQGISSEEMRAVCVDLGREGGDGKNILDGKQFDVILSSQAYHHFPSIGEVTRNLSCYLKPNDGVLIVVDLLRENSSTEPSTPPVQTEGTTSCAGHSHAGGIVAHPGGFTEAEIRSAFSFAGIEGSFSFRTFTEFKKHGKTIEMFIASGRLSLE